MFHPQCSSSSVPVPVFQNVLTRCLLLFCTSHLSLRDGEKPFLFALADGLVLEKLRAELGFSCCQKFFSGAAPIGSETVQFFLGLNIRLYEAYGMSESTGPHFMSGPRAYKLPR